MTKGKRNSTHSIGPSMQTLMGFYQTPIWLRRTENVIGRPKVSFDPHQQINYGYFGILWVLCLQFGDSFGHVEARVCLCAPG